MTSEKLKESLDLTFKIERIQRLAPNEIDPNEPYYDEIVTILSEKRKEQIEKLKKEFEEL